MFLKTYKTRLCKKKEFLYEEMSFTNANEIGALHSTVEV